MKKTLILFFILFNINYLTSQIQIKKTDTDLVNCLIIDPKGEVREHNVDFKKLVLDLKFNTKNSEVIGRAKYQFQPIRSDVTSIFLDAPNINIISVEVDNQAIHFDLVDGGISIKFNTPLNWDKNYFLDIRYNTQPQKGLYFVGWNDKTSRSRKQIWTQGQGIDNRHWIPSYDGVNDKLLTETKITFESGYEVISNGEVFRRTVNKNNTTTWHYIMDKPHALYLMMVAIGKYNYRDYVSNKGIVSRQYYYPEKKDAEKITYQYSNKMMNWFDTELQVDYPWKVYRNVPVQDFMYGAMENTSATIFTDYYLQNKKEALERNYVGTNAHELAHQWFGDYITEWSGSSHWLHESFATHYSKQFVRTVYGEDYYKWMCREEQQSALRAAKKNDYPIAYTNAGSSRHYPKGSFVLDMLRNVVGEEEYKRTVTKYLQDHALGMVDTHDFEMAFMKHVGMNLKWFFNQWIYKGGEPEYEISYKTRLKKTLVSVKQIHEQNNLIGLFKMPIDFEVHYKDGGVDKKTHWIKDAEQVVAIPNKKMRKVSYVLFDVNSKILKKVKFERTYKELLAQAKNAKNLIDRYDAVDAMKNIDVNKKREDIVDIYLEEDFRAIKQNVLKQLKDDDHSKTEQLYVYALGEKDVKVRRTAIENLTIRSKRYIKFYEEVLKDESYVNAELALLKLCETYPRMKKEYLNRTRHLGKENDKFRITWLKLSFGEQKKLYSDIVDFSSESFEFRTRIKAINTLGEIEYFDTNYMYNIVNAYLSFNRRLKRSATKQLKGFLENKQTGSITGNYISHHDWLPHQKETLDKLLIETGRKIYR